MKTNGSRANEKPAQVKIRKKGNDSSEQKVKKKWTIRLNEIRVDVIETGFKWILKSV